VTLLNFRDFSVCKFFCFQHRILWEIKKVTTSQDDKGFWGCVETWAFVALQANSRFLFACGDSE